MKPKHQRMLYVLAAILIMGTAASVILFRFRDNLIYFYTPTRLRAEAADYSPDRVFRLGGIVKAGSVSKPGPESLLFVVSDGQEEFKVRYEGMPPALFREGQGVVLVGNLNGDGMVEAREILAKHDENYMPPEVAKALKESGHWVDENGHYNAPTGAR